MVYSGNSTNDSADGRPRRPPPPRLVPDSDLGRAVAKLVERQFGIIPAVVPRGDSVEPNKPITCPECDGTGYVVCVVCDGEGYVESEDENE